jgi:glycosyltransferase involved in cell wall biosynthesis
MKPKLAIISTYDELCGIAGYTKALVPQLEKDFDVTVFDLDQFLFRHESSKVQKIADQEIKRMCGALKSFDSVNIQLEHGTLGRLDKKIFRRLCALIDASPKACVTFHTVFPAESLTFADWLRIVTRNSPLKAMKLIKSTKQAQILGHGIYKFLAQRQRSKPLSVIMHTRRDARMLKVLYGMNHVHDHPLAFYDQQFKRQIAVQSSRQSFAQLSQLKADDVVLGCFGFVGRYKGIDTAIKALRLLPDHYHLAIFGGIHPNEIKKNQSVDPFLAELLRLISPDKTFLSNSEPQAANPESSATKQAPVQSASSALQLRLNANELKELSTARHPDNLAHRVHFMGALSDSDFAKAMAVCDTVLLPYLEVGQSSSGPMSMAVDMGKHIIASRTKTFMQFTRYHPDRFSMFEVGNHVELSQLIASQSKPMSEPLNIPIPYSTSTNADVYRQALLF